MAITITGLGGGARRVNTADQGDQLHVTMTALADGGYVIVWQDGGRAGAPLYMQRYDSSGSAVGGETQIVEFVGHYIFPAVAALPDGNLIVTWQGAGLYVQTFTPSGSPVGAAVTVNTSSLAGYSSPAVSVFPNGSYVIAWMSDDGADSGIYAQRFNASGGRAGAEFRVNTTTAGAQTDPAVAALAGGGFVVTWQTPGADGGGDIHTQRYNASGGAVGAEIRVNTDAVYAQRNPSVVGLADGGYVVVWHHFAQWGGTAYDIYMQRFTASGARVGGEARVNTTVADYEVDASVDALPDGGFVVAWSQYFGGAAVFSQRFDAAGVPVGPETTLATGPVTPENSFPVVAGLVGGAYVVAWAGYDDSGFGVYHSLVGGRADGVLSTALEAASGDEADDEFLAAAGVLSAGDQIDGGGGFDRIRMTSTGTLDFTGVLLTNVEQIVGSAGNDTLVFGEAPGGVAFNSGGGVDTLRLAADTDLADLDLTGNWRVGGAAGADVTLTVHTLGQLAMIDGAGACVTVDASALVLTAEQRADLFARGVDHVVESGGRRFAADGWANHVPTTSAHSGVQASDLAGLANGNIVVVSSAGARVLDRSGAPVSDLVALTTGALGATDPAVTALSGGGFVVAWSELGRDGDGSAIRVQLFNASGATTGSAFTANSMPNGSQLWPSVAALPSGGFVIAWETQNGGAGGVQRFTETGARQGAEAYFNTAPGWRVSVADTSAGGHIVVYQTDYDYGAVARIYGADGQLIGSQIAIDPAARSISVAHLADGGFAMIWRDGSPDGALILQRFDESGARVGAEILLAQAGSAAPLASITATVDGGFVVGWLLLASATPAAVATQRFDAEGRRIGEEQVFAGEYGQLAIAGLAGGGFATAWTAGASTGAAALHIGVTAPMDYHRLTVGADLVPGDGTDTLVVAAGGTLGTGDVLTGGAGVDTVELSSSGVLDIAAASVFSGFEIVLGASGNDTLMLTADRLAGLTRVDGRGGLDTVSFAPAAGAVTISLGGIFANIENLSGSAFGDRLTGDAAANGLFGMDGADVLAGGAGNDVLDGGAGLDTADYSAAAGAVSARLDLGAASNDGDGGSDIFSSIENLTGSAFDDLLVGDAGANVLRGGSGSDVLRGLDGNDTLHGGAGAANLLYGGLGNDTYVVEAASDSVIESAGEGRDTVRTALSRYDLSANVEDLVYTGAAAFFGGGNGLANTIRGGAMADTLVGGGGDDTLIGGGGRDTADYSGAAGGVTARLDTGSASNDGDGGTDVFASIEDLTGSAFDDLLYGDAGANALRGGAGDDILFGQAGDDVLYGGGGDDLVDGGAGMDVFQVEGAAADYILLRDGDGFILKGTEGGDHLVDIEFVVFGDGVIWDLGRQYDDGAPLTPPPAEGGGKGGDGRLVLPGETDPVLPPIFRDEERFRGPPTLLEDGLADGAPPYRESDGWLF